VEQQQGRTRTIYLAAAIYQTGDISPLLRAKEHGQHTIGRMMSNSNFNFLAVLTDVSGMVWRLQNLLMVKPQNHRLQNFRNTQFSKRPVLKRPV
jgi:hypothetical protein